MFGLLKSKLNPTDHLDIINYLIVEEAEQQWNYHAVENNFDKKAFRSSSFAKDVVNMFVTKILKMKADDKILMTIVDLGHRRCQEYITEYAEKKVLIKKITDEKLLFNYFSIEIYFNHISEKHSDLKSMNELLMIEGKESVDFNYRKQAYELITETNRELQLIIKTMYERFSKNKTDSVMDKHKKTWNKLKEEDRKSWIKNIRDRIMDTIEDRNPNNLLD
jgi:hypothetical protein